MNPTQFAIVGALRPVYVAVLSDIITQGEDPAFLKELLESLWVK